jgi:hypothetical protein
MVYIHKKEEAPNYINKLAKAYIYLEFQASLIN